jgi:hypothetical protein
MESPMDIINRMNESMYDSQDKLQQIVEQDLRDREELRIKIRNEERWFNAMLMFLMTMITALFTILLEQLFK